MADAASFSDVEARRGAVIAAIRFDDEGRQCLRQALLRAVQTGRPAIVLHVLHETVRTMGLYRSHDDGEVLRPNAEVARELLADFSAEVIADEPARAELSLRHMVVSGVPERRIVEVARLAGAELIVMGGRPKVGLDRLLCRNVTGAVLRRAPCPVVVVDAGGNSLGPKQLRQGRREHALPPAMQMP